MALGPVFNSYGYGGYLISQNVKTFIDGRTDQLFLGGFMKRLMDATAKETPDDLQKIIHEHGAKWAFVATKSKEQELLDKMSGWTKTYSDDVASVYVLRP